jgi:hypothetical protein
MNVHIFMILEMYHKIIFQMGHGILMVLLEI